MGRNAASYSSYVLFLANIASDRPLALTPSTVERTRWFFLGIECFALFGAMLPISDSMAYFPGDDIEKNLLDSMDYQKLPSGRMQTVQEFIHSPSFGCDILKACISSIPRRGFIRASQVGPGKKSKFSAEDPRADSGEEFGYVSAPGNLRGLDRGQKGFLDDARRILKGRNSLAEFFVDRSRDAPAVRLGIWRSLCASAAYLGEKNLPYTKPIRPKLPTK